MNNPSVNIIRLIYLLICQLAGVAVALSTAGTEIEISIATGLFCALGVGIIFIGIERLTKGYTLRGFSTATFGLGVGLLCAWLLTRVEISKLLELAFSEKIFDSSDSQGWIISMRLAFDVTLFSSLGFLGAALALRGNREDFAFIIPYVRFRQDTSSGQPIVLDAESIMDGRLFGLAKSGFVRGRLIVPNMVLEEIRTIEEEKVGSPVSLRANKGLEILEQMQKDPEIQISFHELRSSAEKENTDLRLIEVSRLYGARLLTNNESLTKVAKLQGVSVLNLNELDLALRPSASVGDLVQIALVRPGKEAHQAVGYFADGTMVVVNDSDSKIGELVQVVVTSILKTATGTMIFGEIKAGSS